jgi:hypothetical protein
MSAASKLLLIVLASFLVLGILISCGPSAPQKGTPAFFWAAARETYASGDYQKTLEHLDELLATDNEYVARALPWDLILISGLASGYMEMADQYQAGAKIKKDAPAAFFKNLNNYRSLAGRLTLQFAENFGKFSKLQGDSVALEFAFPPGSALDIPQLKTVAEGNLLPAADTAAVEKRALARGLQLAIARATGNPDNVAKGEEILRAPDAKVPRTVFLLAMAGTLYDQSQLYGQLKVNDRDKMTIFCQRAQDTLKLVPESKDSKDLSTKIKDTLKKNKVS